MGEESLTNLKYKLGKYVVSLDNFKVIKNIGKGGYGEVYEAEDVINHCLVAVKKLLTNKLEGKQLKFFCREVEILANNDNPFVLKFIGFTDVYPFSIITQYIPNGSLFDALRHKTNSPLLSPTQKTLIAMSIAYGMIHLHEMNIIHRDLKSLNILLDQRNLPRICDFGIARFHNDEEQPLTQEIGTPHWMAPEIYEGNNYSNKVDVYSYGLLLWEMLYEETPFKGRNASQIMTAVCKNRERPVIPQNAPETLKMLIQQCWHQTPEERPKFSYIYKLFQKKKVVFADTDEKAVDLLVKSIRKHARLHRKAKNTQIKEIDESNNFDINIAPNFNFLEDAQKPEYEISISEIFNDLDLQRSEEFFITSKGLLDSSFTPVDKLMELLSSFHTLFIRDSDFITVFIKCKLHMSLPFENPVVIDIVFKLMILVLSHDIKSFPLEFLSRMMGCMERHGKKLVRVISIYVISYEKLENKDEITNLILDHASGIIDNGGGLSFLQMLNYLLASYPPFENKYMDKCVQILQITINSKDKSIVVATYSLICSNWNIKLCPLNSVLFEHINSNDYKKYALSVLYRLHEKQIEPKFILPILDLIKTYPNAAFFICQISRDIGMARCIFEQRKIWLKFPFFYSHKLRILCVLSQHFEIRLLMSEEIDLYGEIFKSLVSDGNSESITAISSFICIFSISKSFAEYLDSINLIDHVLCYNRDVESNIEMVDRISDTYITNSFFPIIQQISNFLKSHESNISSSIRVITKLSRITEFRELIKDSDILRELTQRVVSKESESNMNEILRNLNVSLDDAFFF